MSELQVRADYWLEEPSCMIDQWPFYIEHWWGLTDSQRNKVKEKLARMTHPTDIKHIKEPYSRKIEELNSTKRITRSQRKI